MECKWTDATGCSNSLQREQCWQSCLEPIKYVQKQQFCLTLVGREQSKSRAIHEQSEVSLTNSWGVFLSDFLLMLLFQEALCEWAVLTLLVARFIMLKWTLSIKTWFLLPHTRSHHHCGQGKIFCWAPLDFCYGIWDISHFWILLALCHVKIY